MASEYSTYLQLACDKHVRLELTLVLQNKIMKQKLFLKINFVYHNEKKTKIQGKSQLHAKFSFLYYRVARRLYGQALSKHFLHVT